MSIHPIMAAALAPFAPAPAPKQPEAPMPDIYAEKRLDDAREFLAELREDYEL